MQISKTTVPEAIVKLMPWSFTSLFWNNELVWDDSVSFEDYVPLEEAIDNFEKKHPGFKSAYVQQVKVTVVDYHHSTISMYGVIKNEPF